MAKATYTRVNITETYLRGLRSPVDMTISDTATPGLHARYSAASGRSYFYIHYRTRFTRLQRNMKLGMLGDFSLKEIRHRAAKVRQQVCDGLDPLLELQKSITAEYERQKNDKKVGEAFPEFYDKHCKLHLNDDSVKYYESNFRIYILPRIADKRVSAIDTADIQDIYDLICKQRAVATADHVLACISVFLTWCEKYKYRALNSNPCRLVQKGKKKKLTYITLDIEGYKKLFCALDAGIKQNTYAEVAFLAIKALALTSCRCSEITDLEHDELDLENGYLRLKKRKTDSFNVPLGVPAVDVIRRALAVCKSDKYVFHSPRDTTRPIVDLRRAFWWALDKAGLPKMRIHDLRHSFATLAANMGENMQMLKEVLGHTRVSTTEIYAHTNNAAAKKTAQNVSSMIVG